MSLLQGITLSVVYGILGTVLLFLSVVIIDKILTKVDFIEELLKGNKAIATVIGFYMLSISIIIASAIF